jgi:hypothetical protein
LSHMTVVARQAGSIAANPWFGICRDKFDKPVSSSNPVATEFAAEGLPDFKAATVIWH